MLEEERYRTVAQSNTQKVKPAHITQVPRVAEPSAAAEGILLTLEDPESVDPFRRTRVKAVPFCSLGALEPSAFCYIWGALCVFSLWFFI
ncbi:hypothetical protein CEXT_75491 [Caerostris extrusa]|uniref:Uncharacterized protein n=1 Tax=Caerostris extrusa TaxID=172846 RepID=A0AAV4XS64_CAEEX|nr:hypothetical protein CEXT_75491 [Caerostris extrusa]